MLRIAYSAVTLEERVPTEEVCQEAFNDRDRVGLVYVASFCLL